MKLNSKPFLWIILAISAIFTITGSYVFGIVLAGLCIWQLWKHRNISNEKQ
jgi:hypothetical protein